MATVLIPIERALDLSCAVEVFLATALMHTAFPERDDFTIQEIVARAGREKLTGILRPGVQVHLSQHCVANKAPSPLKWRMLFATGKHTRRLSLPNDIGHPQRDGRIFPDEDELPAAYRHLLSWARERFERVLDSPAFWAEDADERVRQIRSDDLLASGYIQRDYGSAATGVLQPLLDAKGIGIEMAHGVDLDEHLRQLREGWE